MATICDDKVYKIGNAPTLHGTFRADPPDPDTLGALADPTVVRFKVKTESTGATVTYTYGTDGNVTKTSTGIYKCALPVQTVSDRFLVTLEGTGAINATDYDEFTVIAPS